MVVENSERFIGKYLKHGDEKNVQYAKLVENDRFNEIKIEHSNYNWSINLKD